MKCVLETAIAWYAWWFPVAFSGGGGKNLAWSPATIVQAQISGQRRLIILGKKMNVYLF
jgi:hypothetical protein